MEVEIPERGFLEILNEFEVFQTTSGAFRAPLV
jgi:hypothetical protein